ncbi:PhzF family phenazine biosynthesis protein [Halobacillus sp. ACCC02827]|uniref:PhzF family phenazine biosynthesis protein n=1 Tax=Halobacillus sp. ACCC02827 TaxID=3052090 RepID=UPI00256FD962|nr:PhzF family phenazine biosynthesis protein [Halobacillus sp. ACCC02827]WJE15074.1 PhzF family phenazine biosynthesis protein [Halobacillus sp. ACCC02827]
MKKISYSILDVFSQGKYTGNQLAVFRNAENLSSDEMQQIAKEINFSETSFLLSSTRINGGYDVRIFTPNEEVPFAGHPALGTAYIIQREILNETKKDITLNFISGQTPIMFDEGKQIYWMNLNEPAFGRILNREEIAAVLTINQTCIDHRFPIQEVSTGLPIIIVPLLSLEAVRSVRLNKNKYYELIKQTDAKAIMVFSSETYSPDNHLNVRDFADYYGIPEDAATGSSNGSLASYLVKYRYFNEDKINIRTEQGYEINRPSLLYLRAEKINDKITATIGGRVEKIAQGDWFTRS